MTPKHIYLILPISNKKLIFLAIRTHFALKLAYLQKITHSSKKKQYIYLILPISNKKNNILSHQNTSGTQTSIFIQINKKRCNLRKKKQYIYLILPISN
jgi:hypothetical protein